jgi:uncharacterized RDD family membrane protein YckC
MSPSELVNGPPHVDLLSYPISIGVTLGVVLTSILLVVSGRFDPTQGVLTISIMIVLGMLGATGYCLIFTIPTDDITPGIVGGLTAGFGAVVAHWLGRRDQGGEK